ncbi:putative FMN/FAD exporter YeeO [Candidatus Hepatincola sp. Pdp]
MYSKKEFYKAYAFMLFPLLLQQFINTSLNLIDNLMVGQLGVQAISAVGFANKLYFLFVVTIFGALGGCSIFIAQYFGNRNYRAIRKVFAIIISIGFMVSLVYSAIAFFGAEKFLQLFSKEPAIIQQGSSYLHIIAISFIFNALSLAFTYSLRAMGFNKIVLGIAILVTGCNTILNYFLIYGNGFFPKLEVKGAALATTIARFIEICCFVYLFCQTKYHLRNHFSSYFWLSKKVIKSIINVSIPIVFNEFLWSLGTTILFIAYAQLGTSAGVAANISDVLISISLIIFMGASTTANILIAQTIGSGNSQKASWLSDQIMQISLLLSLLTTIICFFSIKPLLGFYALDATTYQITKKVLIIISIAIFFKMINWTIIIGILRAGGDTKWAFLIDVTPLFVYAIPVAFFASMYLKLDIYMVVLLANIEEIIKIIIAFARYRSKKWILQII